MVWLKGCDTVFYQINAFLHFTFVKTKLNYSLPNHFATTVFLDNIVTSLGSALGDSTGIEKLCVYCKLIDSLCQTYVWHRSHERSIRLWTGSADIRINTDFFSNKLLEIVIWLCLYVFCIDFTSKRTYARAYKTWPPPSGLTSLFFLRYYKLMAFVKDYLTILHWIICMWVVNVICDLCCVNSLHDSNANRFAFVEWVI